MLQLSDKFIKALIAQPETGMGFQIADVTLNDGRVFNRTSIINCELIAAVHGHKDIPFTEPEIAKIAVTHEKFTP